MAYDVAINSTFFLKVGGSLLFQTFLITIAMEGLEDKYKMELDKNGKFIFQFPIGTNTNCTTFLL